MDGEVAVCRENDKFVLSLGVDRSGVKHMDIDVILGAACSVNQFSDLLQDTVSTGDLGSGVRGSVSTVFEDFENGSDSSISNIGKLLVS